MWSVTMWSVAMSNGPLNITLNMKLTSSNSRICESRVGERVSVIMKVRKSSLILNCDDFAIFIKFEEFAPIDKDTNVI